jgi:nucleoside-diphosphate-sugar epimerase
MGDILVTGATGFTGSALCRRLRGDGHNVVAFVRPTSNTTELSNLGVRCQVVDICNRQEVLTRFDNIAKVYHIAAAYRAEHSTTEEFRQVNVEATRNLLEAAKTKGVERFIHCSTVGVQGEISDPPADEEYRFQPGDHYQESKLQGELLAREYFQAGLPGTVFRPVGIYGPGDTRFLKLFKSVDKGVFLMIGSGQVLYHMTYIDDLIDGIILCGNHPKALGQVFTLGGNGYTTLKELVDSITDVLGKPHPKLRIPYAPVYWASVVCDKLCKMVGVSPPLYPRRVEFFAKDRAFSIEKAKSLLGYNPQFDLIRGLSRTACWYREKGLLHRQK